LRVVEQVFDEGGFRCVAASTLVDYACQGTVKFAQFAHPRPDSGQVIGTPVANVRTGNRVAVDKFEEASNVIDAKPEVSGPYDDAKAFTMVSVVHAISVFGTRRFWQ
jgi:hypothetical protein